MEPPLKSSVRSLLRYMWTAPRATELPDAVFSKVDLKYGKPCSPLTFRSYFQFKLSPNPSEWRLSSLPSHAEQDDELHRLEDPSDLRDASCTDVFSLRGLLNIGLSVVIVLGLLLLLYVQTFILILLRDR